MLHLERDGRATSPTNEATHRAASETTQSPSTGQVQSATAASQPSVPRILIVDDQPEEAETIKRCVQHARNFDPIVFDIVGSWADASELLAKWAYALVIVDVCLIGSDPTDGHELLNELAILYESIAVIAITGRAVSLDDQNPIVQRHPGATICYKSAATFGTATQLISGNQGAYDKSLAEAVKRVLAKSDAERQQQRPSGSFRGVELDGRWLLGATGKSVWITPKQAEVLAELMRAAPNDRGVDRDTLSQLGLNDGPRKSKDTKLSLESAVSALRTHLKAVNAPFGIALNNERYALSKGTKHAR